MGEAYHEELASIGEGLVNMANLVGSALGRATSALLDADLQLAESVISAHSPFSARGRSHSHVCSTRSGSATVHPPVPEHQRRRP